MQMNRIHISLILLGALLLALPATASAEDLRNDGWDDGLSVSGDFRVGVQFQHAGRRLSLSAGVG